jgi:hypothetical protein
MLDSPIKFPSSLSSSENDLPAHQSCEEDVSSDDWRPFDYRPLWSSEKEDSNEEDKEDKDVDDTDAEDNDDSDDSNSNDSDSDSNFALPPPKRARHHMFRFNSL